MYVTYRKGACVCLTALLALLLTACGGSKNEQVSAGMQAIEELNYEQALSDFEKALVNGEDTELIYRGQGIAYLGLTRYEEAADAFVKALGNATGAGNLEYDINYYLATAYTRAGKIDEAIEVYTAITNLRPKEKDACFYRGALELGKGELEKAVSDFDRAIAIAPRDYALYVDISNSLSDAGEQEIADSYLNRALETEDKDMTDFDKGCLYYYLGDYQNARDCLERAKDKQGNAQTVLFLGKTYEALQDYNYAASVYANYLAGDAAQPQLQNQLGICYLRMEKYEEALAAFEAGLEIEENNDCLQVLKFNEIVAHEYLGRFDQASTLMQAYLKTYPDDASAVREYEFLKTR
ncbi:MAG: tetratricopeptide repeat protein [Lachnospiraceae bacterium]|nr:tetratricopeptide repeat protein [Lachnospiraceae bacterium]